MPVLQQNRHESFAFNASDFANIKHALFYYAVMNQRCSNRVIRTSFLYIEQNSPRHYPPMSRVTLDICHIGSK